MTEWQKLSRHEKLASVLYPHLTSEKVQAQMAELAANEGKRPPQPASLFADGERGAVSRAVPTDLVRDIVRDNTWRTSRLGPTAADCDRLVNVQDALDRAKRR